MVKIAISIITLSGRSCIKKIIGKAPVETDENAEKDKTVILSFEEL